MLENNTKACQKCGQNFDCQASSEKCWCFELPPIIKIEKNAAGEATCFCPTCLYELIATQLSDLNK